MTPQEAQMLQELVSKVEGTKLTEKDPEAEGLLKNAFSRDPDALYKLAQTVLIQNMAIEQFQGQLQQLQEQVQELQEHLEADEEQLRARQQPAKSTSFLGSLLGKRDPEPQYIPPQGQQYNQQQYQQVPPQYANAPAPGYGQGYAPAPAYGQPGYVQQPSAGGSFLRSAATTAAGVAAGALAFEGIESLIHGGEREFGGGGFGGGGFGGGYGDRPVVEETVINNYGDDGDRYNERREQEASYDDRVSGPDEQPQGSFQDASDDNFGTDDDSFSGGDDNFGNDDFA